MGGFVGQLANYYGGCLLQAGATFSESTCAEALPKFVRARGTSFNTPPPTPSTAKDCAPALRHGCRTMGAACYWLVLPSSLQHLS